MTQKNENKKRPTRKEVSAGSVVFKRTEDGPKFLILYHRGAYWNFPKGKLEEGENSFEAAIRETEEETGLKRSDLKQIPGFKAYERFTFRSGKESIFKTVAFYLMETDKFNITIFEGRHQGYGWFLFRDAKKILGKHHKDSQKVLKKAYDFIQKKDNKSSKKNTKRGNKNVQRGGSSRRSSGRPSRGRNSS